MRNSARNVFVTGTFGLVLALAPLVGQSVAQPTTDTSTAGSAGSARTGTMRATTDTRTTDRNEGGFNPSWLGLLSLAGLLGLMPKKTHPVATTTTHRTGDGVTRSTDQPPPTSLSPGEPTPGSSGVSVA